MKFLFYASYSSGLQQSAKRQKVWGVSLLAGDGVSGYQSSLRTHDKLLPDQVPECSEDR